MITFFIGAAVAIAAMAAAIFSIKGDGTTAMLFQWHAIELVFGGTVGIVLLSNPASVLRNVSGVIGELFRSASSFAQHSDVLAKLAVDRFDVAPNAHPLIRYAAELWEQGVDSDMFSGALMLRKKELERRYVEAIHAVRALSKYPPALGMLGTVISMVSMFQGIEGNKSEIGMQLSVAMTATFVGLLLANVVISPLADRITVRHLSKKKELESLCEVLIFIHAGEPVSFVKGEIQSRAA